MRLELSRNRRWLFLVVVVWGLAGIAAARGVAAAETPRLAHDGDLPLPSQYEERVRFWVDVFTRYHLNEAIVHDRDRPEHVLAVVPLRTGSRAELDEIEGRYRDLIGRLGRSDPMDQLEFLHQFQAPIDPRWIVAAQDRLRVQPGQREVFGRGLVRSRLLLEMVRRELRDAQIPEMVAYLPHIESSFDADASSSAGARGLWQLMPDTARRYLRVDAAVDERLQPLKATRAAAQYLRMGYELLGSWPLAITAYNYGVNGMRRATAALGTNELSTVIEGHESPAFGFACKNFYIQFLAAAHVAMNQRHYFPEMRPWQVYVVREGDTLWQIARRHGITIEALQTENREALAESRYLKLGQRLMISG
jgi:membrane-bound lytic murein transglycosylase D